MCVEHLGKPGEACRWYRMAAARARAAGQLDRVTFAEERVKQLGCP
jgi:hypothetical protein